MRLFFALWPDEPVRRALARAAGAALHDSDGRPVPDFNWHVTLAFLGNVAEERLSSLREVANGLAFEPCSLRLDGIEHWPKANVLCAVAQAPPPALQTLVQNLQQALTKQGFTPDPKPWRPHLTLARKVVKPAQCSAIAAIDWQVTGFVLVESQTLAEGSRYSVIERWPK